MSDVMSNSAIIRKRRKVLFIAYFYFQDEMVASNRTHAIFDYLGDFGWDVTLLTAVPPSFRLEDSNKSNLVAVPHYPGFLKIYYSLSSKNSWGIDVRKSDSSVGFSKNIFSRNLSIMKKILSRSDFLQKGCKSIFTLVSFIFFPDLYAGWYRPAYTKAMYELKSGEYDAILSTSGPFTAHKLASKLSKKCNLPWIADFRDPWALRRFETHPVSSWRKQLEMKYELSTMHVVDELTTVSIPLADEFSANHHKRTSVIYNGFDPVRANQGAKLRPKFTITYTGTVYNREVSNPEILFRAVSELIQNRDIDPAKIQIDFYGPVSEWLDADIIKYHLQDVVIQNGMVTKDKSVLCQQTSQLLLLFVMAGPSGSGVLTGKLFEYLGAKRPIIAVGGENITIEGLFRACQVGQLFTSVKLLKQQLMSWYLEYEKTGFVAYNGLPSEIENYSYRSMAKKFSEILGRVVDKK